MRLNFLSVFRQEPGKTLADLLRQVEAESEGWPLECVAAPGAERSSWRGAQGV